MRLALASLFVALAPTADRLVTSDGRVIDIQRARRLASGDYSLHFESGVVVCPPHLIASVEIEGDMADYIPRDDNERQRLEQGFVRYGGKWMSKTAYAAALRREADVARRATDELAAHSEFDAGWETETRHFALKTNTSPEHLAEYAELFEAYYALMEQSLDIKSTPTHSRKKMRINIFKSRADLNRETGTGNEVAGFFSSRDRELNFYHDYDDPHLGQWIGLHECTHLITHLLDAQARVPIWLSEGVADFYGSSTVATNEKGELQITPGRLQLDRMLTVQQAIEDGDSLRLEKLLTLAKRDFYAFEYAHAWSFVYFLNMSAEYAPRFRRFFRDVYTTPRGVEHTFSGRTKSVAPDEVRRLLMEELGLEDLDALEREWLAYVRDIEVDGQEALFRRGYGAALNGQVDDFAQAREDLDAAIRSDRGNARAYWARAVVRMVGERADRPGGIADLRRAVELAPLDPRFRFTLAQTLTGSPFVPGGSFLSMSNDAPLLGTPAELSEAATLMAMTCELAPENTHFRDFFDKYRERLREHRQSAK